ncbi:MAG: ABC transporter permease [Candidatus Helarchaeota archaeon]
MLTKKNIELYFKKGPVIIFGLLFPFFMILAWVIGRSIDPIQLFSAVLGMAVFFMSTSISPVIFPWETREKNLERILSAPITLFDFVFSIVLASTIFTVLLSSIICIILLIFLEMPIWIFGWFIVNALLFSWASSALGVLIAVPPTDMTSNIMTLSTLVKFPLIFISGIFIALNELSYPFFILALFSPITYFVDLLKSPFGVGSLGFGIDLTALAIWAILLFLLAVILHKKTYLKRF